MLQRDIGEIDDITNTFKDIIESKNPINLLLVFKVLSENVEEMLTKKFKSYFFFLVFNTF